MDAKILFIFPSRSNFTSVDISASTDENDDTTKAVKGSMQVINKMTKATGSVVVLPEAAYRNVYKLAEFQSFISSDGDRYRIFVLNKTCDEFDRLFSPLPTQQDI